jgi:ABC-type sugar transport system ATPase subunit
MAVLLASSELPELLLLCDRILAMYAGRIVGEVSAGDATEERLATLITGAGRVAGVGFQVLGGGTE